MRRVSVAILSAALLFILTLSSFSIFPHLPAVRAADSNLVKNGDFGSGLSDWTTVQVHTSSGIRGVYPIFEVLTQMPAPESVCTPKGKLGNPFLNIEVPFGADGYVEQQVTIPSAGPHLSFVSWGWEDVIGLVGARVAIVDASGAVHTLDTFTPPPMLNVGDPNNPNDDTCTGKSPLVKSYDLSAYSGQTIKLRLGATSQNCCGTNALFDDVNIEGISCASDPNFHYNVFQISPSISFSVPYTGVSVTVHSLNVKITTIMPNFDFITFAKDPNLERAFARDIMSCFGINLEVNAVWGGIVIVSIEGQGLQTLLADLDTAWNYAIGWLPWVGSIDLNGTTKPSFDAQGNLNFFGFFQLFSAATNIDSATSFLAFLGNEIQIFLQNMKRYESTGPASTVTKILGALDGLAAVLNFGAGVLQQNGSAYKEGFKIDLKSLHDSLSVLHKVSTFIQRAIDLIMNVADTAIGKISNFVVALMDGIYLALYYFLGSDNNITKAFDQVIDWVTVFLDPPGATIYPAVISSNSQLILGYRSNSSFLWNSTGLGFVIADSDSWMLFLTNSTMVQDPTFTLSHIGIQSVSVPYLSSISTGQFGVPAISAGSLSNNEKVESSLNLTSVNNTSTADWTNKVKISQVESTSPSEGSLVITGEVTASEVPVNATVQALINGTEVTSTIADENGVFTINLAGVSAETRILLLAIFPGSFGDSYLIANTTPPSITSGQQGKSFLLHDIVQADAQCQDELSGVDTCIFSTAMLDTSTVGLHTYTVTSTNRAGNTAKLTVYYTVHYDYLPVSPQPSGRGTQFGRTIPVRFQLTDALGTFISADTVRIWVDSIPNLGRSSGSSNSGNYFRYDSTSNQYIFNLSTSGMTAGSHTLYITLDDGTAKTIAITLT